MWEKDDAPDTNVRFAIRFILNRAIGQSGEIKGVNEIGYCLEPLYNYEIEKVAYYVYNLESPGGLYDQSYCVAAGLTKRDNYGWIMIRPYHALNGKLINIHYGGFSMDKDGYGIYSWGGKFEGLEQVLGLANMLINRTSKKLERLMARESFMI